VTRAQALLIIIGNPMILSLDPLWRKFLNFIHTRGGWRGKEIDWNPEAPVNPGEEGYDGELRDRAEREMEETLERLKALIINVTDGSELEFDLSEDSDSDHDETPIFREAE
jgi:helicase MOV-10